jgi:ribosomal protein L11 methyltransferase
MAFGTGTHPTTRLCLEAMEDLSMAGVRVLDLGTGSGVLAIAAAKTGAAAVHAVDVDDIAVRAARENVAANGVAEVVRVAHGSLDAAEGSYDLILVNILARVIVSLLEQGLAAALTVGGTVIASGIIDDQEAGVRAAFERSGIEIVGRRSERDWVALIGKRRA